MKRATRIAPINRARRKRLHARNFGPKAEWIRDQPCEVTGVCRDFGSRIVAAHMVARGMGGCGGDSTHLVPLEWSVHSDFDTYTEAQFEARYGRTKESVRESAAWYEQAWQMEGDDAA